MREPEDRIIRLKTVLARTGLSRSTIYRKIADGTFPAQLKISTNGTDESDINLWLEDSVSWRPKLSAMRSDEGLYGSMQDETAEPVRTQVSIGGENPGPYR
jgi:prophage regulatory protein